MCYGPRPVPAGRGPSGSPFVVIGSRARDPPVVPAGGSLWPDRWSRPGWPPCGSGPWKRVPWSAGAIASGTSRSPASRRMWRGSPSRVPPRQRGQPAPRHLPKCFWRPEFFKLCLLLKGFLPGALGSCRSSRWFPRRTSQLPRPRPRGLRVLHRIIGWRLDLNVRVLPRSPRFLWPPPRPIVSAPGALWFLISSLSQEGSFCGLGSPCWVLSP